MRSIAFTLALMAGGHSAAAAQIQEVPFEFSSLSSNFVAKGYFEGRVAVHPDSVVIVFDSVYIELASDEILDSMTVGFASSTGGSGWRKYSEGPTWVIPDSLAERPSSSLRGLRASIPRPPDEVLAASWLVASFYSMVSPELVPPGVRQVPSSSHAHSSRRLFAFVKR